LPKVTLLLEHIPLAATDYFVARCRREYTTNVETVCGIVRIIFIFLRLIWYDTIKQRGKQPARWCNGQGALDSRLKRSRVRASAIALSGSNLGQVVRTRVPLSPKYNFVLPRGGNGLRQER